MDPNFLTLELNLPTLAAIASAVWFLWSRYQALEARLDLADAERRELAHKQQMARLAEQSNVDRLDLFCNGNRELINHRSDRFQMAINAIESRFREDIKEIKDFLAKTTQFRERNRVD